MKYFSEILKEFSSQQRFVVLFLLLFFTCGTVIISQYLKFDDCRELYEQNIKMQKDIITISYILNKPTLGRMKNQLDSSLVPFDNQKMQLLSSPDENEIKIDSVLKILNNYNVK